MGKTMLATIGVAAIPNSGVWSSTVRNYGDNNMDGYLDGDPAPPTISPRSSGLRLSLPADNAAWVELRGGG